MDGINIIKTTAELLVISESINEQKQMIINDED